MSSRAFPWKMVLVGGAVALLVVAIGGYQYVIRSFIQAYYTSEYRPEALTAAELGQPPATHRLTDVPWLSETPALCQSISLRMLAAQQGRVESRPTIDFMMGFTWGATAIPRRTGFFPGQDPEVGFLRAAPYLGFTRRYLTTDNSRNSFILALITCGEGWHNNHHFHQNTANQGWFWWEVDFTFYALKVLSWFGVVSDLRLPSEQTKLCYLKYTDAQRAQLKAEAKFNAWRTPPQRKPSVTPDELPALGMGMAQVMIKR